MENLTDERISELVKDFQSSFCPYGYMDIQRAVTIMAEVGKRPEDLVEAIEDFCNDTDSNQDKIDPVYIAYDMIFQEVRGQIEEATGKDICNDVKECIEIHGNYMCSSFDYSEGAKKEFMKIVKKIPTADRSILLNWVIDEIS